MSEKNEEEQCPWLGHICDECAIGVWNNVQWNRDLEGRPLTIRCKFHRGGKVGIIRGSKACEHFEMKK